MKKKDGILTTGLKINKYFYMNIRLIYYLSLFFLVIGCSKKQKNTYYDSGEIKSKVYLNNENIPHGEYEEYYISGNLKTKTNYKNGKIVDTVYHFHKNGNIKEKGFLSNGKKTKWWETYDISGDFIGFEEYIILTDSTTSYKNQTKRMKNGKIDYAKSSFFEISIPDTLKLGKNMGSIDYYSNLGSNQKKYLSVVIENQYSNLEIKKDTFAEYPNSSRFGIYNHKAGPKIIKGEIIEKLINTVEINKDSSELTITEYRKYFKKEVFVKR